MSTRDRLTIAAALAVALASTALLPVYEDLGWLVRVLGGVVAVAGATSLARLVGVPRVLQPLAGALGLGAYTAVMFAGTTLAYAFVPTAETFRSLGATLGQGLLDVEQLGPPVPTTPGLVLLAVLGTGAIAVVVDALAVTLRRVAVTGLPLLLLFAVPSAVLPGGLGLLPFVLGAAGWLGLLLADSSDRVSRWGTPLRSTAATSVDPSLGRVGRRIGVAALGVAVVVPALVPGLDGRLLGGTGDGSGLGGSRTTTTYNPILSLAGQLRLPEPQDLLTYRTDAEPDYLRLTTLDLFDEATGWSSSELSGDIDDDAVQGGIPEPVGRSAPTDRASVEIELAGSLDGPWLPVATVPAEVEVDGPWLWDAEAGTVFSTRTSVQEVEDPYTVVRASVQPDATLLRRAQTVPSEIAETYAQVPELSPYTRDLLERTTAGQPTAYDKVVALQRLFRETGGFEYSEDASVPGTNAPDALENFLIGRRGFCEQYSSAMAAMVRGLGIPARVAVGFTTGDQVEPGRYRVTTDEAHAWPEVWFSGAGWVRFEPTPRVSQVTTPAYTLRATETEDTDTDAAAPSAAPAAPQTAPTTGPSAQDRAAQDGVAAGADGTDDGAGSSPWLLVVPAVLLLLAAPALLAAARRRRRAATPGALSAWATVQDDAVDVGHRWRPADSPRTAAAHLAASRSLPPRSAEALERVAAATELARYARPDSAGDSADLHRDAGVVREGLLASAPARDRWRARLAPPSTLTWAASGAGTAVADALDRLDAAVTAVGTRVRHPRGAVRRAG